MALSWMPWIFLSVAILFEVAGITSMKLSRGFAELLPSIGVFVFYICSAAAVILALRRLELSVAYAIWSGVGTALTAMIGFAYFREPFTLVKLASLGLVVAGVVGLSLTGKTIADRKARRFLLVFRARTVFLARAVGSSGLRRLPPCSSSWRQSSFFARSGGSASPRGGAGSPIAASPASTLWCCG